MGAGLIGFLAGSQYYSRSMVSLREQLDALPGIAAERDKLQQQVVNLDIADKVNKLAQEKLRERVTELQTERIELEGELYVYKKLLEDDEAEQGLSLERLMIKQVEGEANRFT